MNGIDIEQMILIVGFAKCFIAIHSMRIDSYDVCMVDTIINFESFLDPIIIMATLDVGFLKRLLHQIFGGFFPQK